MPNLKNRNLIKPLRTAASKAFGDDDKYHDWLSDNYGVRSTLDLHNGQAIEALKLLSKITGFKGGQRYYTGQGKSGKQQHLTQGQASKIAVLEKILNWQSQNHRLRGFIKRQTGKLTTVEMLMNWEASKVIVGMQRIIAGKNKRLYDYLNTLKITNPESPESKAIIKYIRERLIA